MPREVIDAQAASMSGSPAGQGSPAGSGADAPPSPLPGPILRPPRVGLRRRALQLGYDVAIGCVWAVALPLCLLIGIVRPQLARKALSLSTFGLVKLPPPAPARPRVLVHGVSVGEIKASQSIVAALRERYDVVVSAFSDTGIEVATQLYGGLGIEIVRYPFDFRPLVARFWGRIQPQFVLLMELEAWPCFLRAANRRGVPVAVVSGRITPQSFRRYRMFGSLPEFERISLFAAQDEAYATRFRTLAGGDERVVVTGNVKVDGLRIGEASPDDRAVAELRHSAGLADGAERFVVVAGSTHEPEEAMFVRAARRAVPDARLILVPRHPERSPGVATNLASEGSAPELLSELRHGGTSGDPARPLIVDTIGELEVVYALADVVFVGGSLIPHGGQNMMEPAAQGRAVIYGPNVQNFLQETALLEAASGTCRVDDEAGLAEVLGELFRDPQRRLAMGQRARDAIARQRGATEATLAALRERIGLA